MGNGAISKVLKSAGYKVRSSDKIDRGYGDVADFLIPSTNRIVDSVVTNPPFRWAEEIIRKALECATFKVAMLLRLSFLESLKRRPLFKETPLKMVYVFSDRVTMYPGDQPNRGNGPTAYAWYVWEHWTCRQATDRLDHYEAIRFWPTTKSTGQRLATENYSGRALHLHLSLAAKTTGCSVGRAYARAAIAKFVTANNSLIAIG